ncbi:MAG: DUF3552 domain-containing protein, partial [Bdellovibrionales bacterium]|nr:DUF3552 domain-containing protein [Bdellovibrionales bacterium]
MSVMMVVVVLFLAAFAVGLAMAWLLRRWVIQREFDEAHLEAKELLAEAESNASEIQREAESLLEEYAHQAPSELQSQIRQNEERIEVLSAQLKERETRLQKNFNQKSTIMQRLSSQVGQRKSQVAKRQQQFDKMKDARDRLQKEYKEKLTDLSPLSPDVIKEEIRTQLIQEEQRRISRITETIEGEIHADSEKIARYHLNIALNRFARPYCEERGI